MNLSDYKYIYFLGIGGIGMSAIARWFKAQNFVVAGYDKTQTELTLALEAEGMDVHYDNKVGKIPTDFYKKPETLVVRTPAVPSNNIEFEFFEKERYIILKRAQVLGLITQDLITVAVAGTHGKTTTSSMIAHILKQAGTNVSAFLGGITANYNTNLLIGKPTPTIDIRPDVPTYGKHICVVEADEYDRSFLTLSPDIAVVTSMDADHLDIYGKHEDLILSFNQFINLIKIKGHLIIKNGLDCKPDFKKILYIHEYPTATELKDSVRIEESFFVFDYKTFKNIKMQLPGFHNVENAIAALQTCVLLEVPQDLIIAGLESFTGVKRRFEYIVRTTKVVYIDDYAHHPTEIEAFLSSVKALFPTKKLTCIFQPHLYSRTKDFADGFAQSLSIADEVLLMEIYPARELPMAGVTSDIIFKNITCFKKSVSKENLMETLKNSHYEVLVTVGAGDIDTFVPQIKILIEAI